MPENHTRENQATPALSLADLSRRGLEQGILQVQAAGSPLQHPFLLDETGKLHILYDAAGDSDPMELAFRAIKRRLPNVQRCALVIDSRLTFARGKKWDAIVVMACERGAAEGEVWAQRYVPRGWFKKFRVEGESEMVAKARDFISAALA